MQEPYYYEIELLRVIAIPATVIIAMIFIAILLRSKTIKRIRLGKDGVSLESESSKSRTNHYYMTRRIHDLDVELKSKCRRITNDLQTKVIQNLSGFSEMCDISKAALASNLRIPLYGAVDENGFRRKFSKAYIDAYLNSLIEEIKLEYNQYALVNLRTCGTIKMPEYSEIVPYLKPIIKDYWIKKIKEQMIITCEKKISVYEDYLPLFRDLRDSYMMNVVEQCISKTKNT